MRKFFLLVLFSLLIIIVHSQEYMRPCISISTGTNILYKDVANEVKVSVGNFAGKNSIQIDSGELRVVNGKKYIIPKSTGKLSMKITSEIGQDKISEFYYFESIELPNPKILFTKTNGQVILEDNKISIEDIKNIDRINLSYDIKQISAEAKLKSLKIVGITSNAKPKQIESNNEDLKENFTKILKQLKKGDYLILKDIIVLLPNSNQEKTIGNLCIELN